jgi:MerR family mercuric resistance operon transcriptional regulator
MLTMTIGKAAREAGVNIETVRFYERRSLIEQPPKGKAIGPGQGPDPS